MSTSFFFNASDYLQICDEKSGFIWKDDHTRDWPEIDSTLNNSLRFLFFKTDHNFFFLTDRNLPPFNLHSKKTGILERKILYAFHIELMSICFDGHWRISWDFLISNFFVIELMSTAKFLPKTLQNGLHLCAFMLNNRPQTNVHLTQRPNGF